MNYSENQFLQAYKNKALETFKELINFLDENHLKWWTGFGTAIGVVRHKGFIPWDDDIDIMMPREDYEKLLKMKGHLPSILYIIDYTQDGYYYSAAKCYNNTTTYWEAPQFPFVVGIWIDIFPMDLAPKDVALQKLYEYKAAFRKAVTNYFKISPVIVCHYIRMRQYRSLLATLYYRLRYPFGAAKRMKHFLAYHESYITNQKGDAYYMVGIQHKNRLFPKEWFDRTIKMPFENIVVNMPGEYDKVLRYLYGDYMQMPPEEHRVPAHVYSYINMKERLTMKEIKQRIKQGETLVF